MKRLLLLIVLGYSTFAFSQEYEWNRDLLIKHKIKSVRIYNNSMYHRDSIIPDDEYLISKYQFDSMGNLINIIYPSYSEVDGEYNQELLFEYDANHNLTKKTYSSIHYKTVSEIKRDGNYIITYHNNICDDCDMSPGGVAIEKLDSLERVVLKYQGRHSYLDISKFDYKVTDSNIIKTREDFSIKLEWNEIDKTMPIDENFQYWELMIDSCIANPSTKNAETKFIIDSNKLFSLGDRKSMKTNTLPRVNSAEIKNKADTVIRNFDGGDN
jgi:hypothetical protein